MGDVFRCFTINLIGVLTCLQIPLIPGLEIKGCREPRAPLKSPAAPTNFCREPKNVLVSIHNTCKWLLKMQLGSLENN